MKARIDIAKVLPKAMQAMGRIPAAQGAAN
jgi:hypothetical protein